MKRIIMTEKTLFGFMELANKLGKAESYRHWLANDCELTERLEKLTRVPEGALGFYVIDENGDPKCLKIPDCN